MQRTNGQERGAAAHTDRAAANRAGVGDAEVERRLHALAGTKAPPSLLPVVLVQVGLADAYARLDAPIGPVYLAYNGHGISAVRRARDAAEFGRWFGSRFGRGLQPAAALPSALAQSATEQLHSGRGSDVRFDLRGLSEFEQAVLRKALEIPRGEFRPYAWVAREIGRPRAARAVGNVLANNPVPLLIPCHRVVRSDGRLGDYVFGPEAKRAMLEAEGIEPGWAERLAQSGVRFLGSDTTRIYCFPTCRHARRITESHQVPFASEAQATAARYRPCRVCRPALGS